MLVIALVVGLIVGTVVASHSRDREVLATTVLLGCNWMVNTFGCNVTGLQYPYWWFMATDYLTGLSIILFVPFCFRYAPTRWQVVITVLYGAQIIWHVAFMNSPQNYLVKNYSWWFLYVTAWLQLLTAGWWGVAIINPDIYRAGKRVPSFAFKRVSMGFGEDSQA